MSSGEPIRPSGTPLPTISSPPSASRMNAIILERNGPGAIAQRFFHPGQDEDAADSPGAMIAEVG